MKKVLSLILCAVMVLTLVACGSKNGGDADKGIGDGMPLKEMAEKLLEGLNEEELPMMMPPATLSEMAEGIPLEDGMTKEQVMDELFKSYLFVPAIEGADVVTYDSAIGSIAHSVVLLRLPEGVDVEAVRADIEANANPAKWICVEAEKVNVVAHGNTILLVMSETKTADTIAANFDALWA